MNLIATGLFSAAVFVVAQGGLDPAKAIQDQLQHIRKLPDAERAKVTKQLARQIRQLPRAAEREGLADALSNLATEGDFGRDTLQEVTNTLAQALTEHLRSY